MLGVHFTKFDNEKGLGVIYNGVLWYDVSCEEFLHTFHMKACTHKTH